MTIRKKWYVKLQQINNIEIRNNALWSILEYMATGCHQPLTDLLNEYGECVDLINMVVNDIEKSRRRAEEARRRREERRRNEQIGMNQPRRSKQHIYEQHPAMFIFDGFASYIMTTAYTAGRKAIVEKFGSVNFDKAINMFRKNVLERKQLGSIQRFQVFRDQFTRFIGENKTRLAVA